MRNTRTALTVWAGNLLVPAAIALSLTTAPPADAEHATIAADPPLPPVLVAPATEHHESPTLEAPPAAGPLTPAEQELVDWAYDRFALVGLDVPVVEISFHDDTDPCRGNEGRYQRSGGQARVTVCIPDYESFAFQLQRRRTLVHELAHAWDHANLDEADRTELLEIVDAESWYAPESEWNERGVERFAETIVWGLYDQLRRPTRIDVACDELHADFVRITGSAPLGPIEPVCETDH